MRGWGRVGERGAVRGAVRGWGRVGGRGWDMVGGGRRGRLDAG